MVPHGYSHVPRPRETDNEIMRGKLMTEIAKEKELIDRLGDMEGTERSP